MRRRISIRGYVRPSVRPSVRQSVTPSLSRLLGASYAEYSALFVGFRVQSTMMPKSDGTSRAQFRSELRCFS